MKEATGEVSGTVITIVLIGAVLALGIWFFTTYGKNWISGIFEKNVNSKTGEEIIDTNPINPSPADEPQ